MIHYLIAWPHEHKIARRNIKNGGDFMPDDTICHCGGKMTEVKVPTIPLKEGVEPKLIKGYHCEKCRSGYTENEEDFHSLRERIIEIYQEQEKLKQELEDKLKILREKCKHGLIVECPYKPENEFFYTEPPARRCVICGLVENGWGTGYKILTKNPIKIISREEFYGKINRLHDIKLKTVMSFD